MEAASGALQNQDCDQESAATRLLRFLGGLQRPLYSGPRPALVGTAALRPPPQEVGEGGGLISFAAFLPHQEQENVLQRVLQLPVVSGTCECFQKTYASTKEAHPLVASVCNAYEKGVQGASSLAAWSMEPVVRRLSTQCESSWHSEADCLPIFYLSASLSDSQLVCLPFCLYLTTFLTLYIPLHSCFIYRYR